MKRTNLAIGLVLFGSAATLLQPTAGAAVIIFKDTFDRANSRNIDASLTGITDNTGSSLAADAVYTHAYIDPNNAPPTYGVQDGSPDNGGGAQIISNHLELATGAGTSNAYVNHNFLNSPTFTVSVDFLGPTQTGFQQGGAFAVGMSAAEAASAGDAFGGHSTTSTLTGPKMQDAFGDVADDGFVISDFWVALRGNNTLAWGGIGDDNLFGTATATPKAGNVSVTFISADFNAGTTVKYGVYYNGILKGAGTFPWSGTNENYIGLDARDSSSVGFDNFTVSVPEPTSAGLVAIAIACVAGWRRRQPGCEA